jgi:acyl-CoA hydrolase
VHLTTLGDAPWERQPQSFHDTALFTADNVRTSVNSGVADYVPIFLSEIPLLFKERHRPVDVALLSVSPPDRHGYCSLGVSVDCSLAAAQAATHVVAQVNENMPRTHGDTHIHISRFDAVCEDNVELPAAEPPALDAIRRGE